VFGNPNPDVLSVTGGVILLRLKRKYGATVSKYNLVLLHEDASGTEVRMNQLCDLPPVR
jgi:hypothetical protein